jgi:anti-sigma regulatory factor (Ser/Thr protein kinase)
VVRHAYGPQDASFEASLTLDEGRITLEIRDNGSWRPPRGEYGGRGLLLMRHMCDEMEIERGLGGTTVRMRRHVNGVARAIVDPVAL